MDRTERLVELKRQLTLPVCKNKFAAEGDVFDPWEVFNCFYGSYSSDFDDMAIEVLEAVYSRTRVDEPLSHQMFREVLCIYGFCDYGTSPRGCFPDWDSEFPDLLPDLIDKWKQYRSVMWEEH